MEKMNMKNPMVFKNGIVKAIQITDTHLFDHDESEIFGVKSNVKLKEVLDKILREDIHDTDMIFLTGDISQDETEKSYQNIVTLLDPLNIPIYWIPGNHDDLTQMEFVFKQAKNFHQLCYLSSIHWHFIFLNSKKAGAAEGFLSQKELQMLENALAQNNKNVAIVMHHHPTPVATPLIDQYILQNADDFWNIVIKSNVKLIICGHVHGDYRLKLNHITIESSPATCLQLQKQTRDLKIENKIGYKIYYFDQSDYRAITKLW